MPGNTHATAATRYVQAGDLRFAYRRFGRGDGFPLLMLNYFAANLDDWDPRITAGLADTQEIILLDYPGIGNSTGETQPNVAALTHDCVRFCRALDLKQLNVFGFSLGGMIAQQLGVDYPQLVGRIMLVGTGPRGGEGMTFTELSTEDLDDPISLIMNAFFTSSEASKAAGGAYLGRLKLRLEDRDSSVSRQSAHAQLAAIREWGVIPSQDRYAMLSRIHQPTLVIHGSKDVVVNPINAFLLAQHIPNAQLIMYPDASHGAQSQHAEAFLEHARLFLQG